jgi:hypothetical protein
MAAPLTVPSNPAVHQADYYGCGPECQRHRYWAERRAERHRAWRAEHYGYNTYRYNDPYYRGY